MGLGGCLMLTLSSVCEIAVVGGGLLGESAAVEAELGWRMMSPTVLCRDCRGQR